MKLSAQVVNIHKSYFLKGGIGAFSRGPAHELSFRLEMMGKQGDLSGDAPMRQRNWIS